MALKKIKLEEQKVTSIICTDDFKKENLSKLLGNVDFLELFNNENIKKTVKEQILFYLKKHSSTNKKITSALSLLNLDEKFLDKEMTKLSSGELQKVILLAILAHDSKTIGFYGISLLDSKEKNNLIKIIRLLKNSYNKTIVIISNDTNFIHKISDYVYIVDNDNIVSFGKKYDIFTNFELLDKYNIDIPMTIKFSKMALDKKNKKLGYRDDINDLLKDIYRYK